MRYIQLQCLIFHRAGKIHRLFKKYKKTATFKGDPSISLGVVSDTRVIVYKDTRVVIPNENMQSNCVH